MSSVKIYFDTRRARKDGTYPIKFRIQNNAVFLVSTEFYATEDEFNGNIFAPCANNAKVKNIVLRRKFNKVERYLLDVDDNNKGSLISDKELKKSIEKLFLERDTDERYFVDVMREYKDLCRAKNTKDAYQQTIDKLDAYDPELTYTKLTIQWLISFEDWMRSENLSTNSRSIHLRNIRAVLNYAIENNETDIYPFRKFKIKKETTAHRCLTSEQLSALLHAPLEDYQEPYLDIFKFMFYTIGLNAVDLFDNDTLKVVSGRLVYNRRKTNKFYSIKLEPEAKAILEKYCGIKGIRKLINNGDYRTFMLAMNRGLKEISSELPDRVGKGGRKVRKQVCEHLSAYWARHTWSTIASSLDISSDVISEALGHEYGCRTTHIYIQFDRKKVDTANRKVIDFVNSL